MTEQNASQHVASANGEDGASEQAQAIIDSATEALAAGRVGAALRFARRATEIAGHVPAAWALLGTVAEEAGDYREALEAYRRALELDPDRPGVAERIEALEELLQHEQHPAATQPQASPSPLDRYAPVFLAISMALLVLSIGLAMVVRGQRRAAIDEQYARVMQLGKEYMARQEYDRAEAAFSDALRLKPDDPQARAWLQRAQQGRQMLARIQQWNYTTAGGKFPGQQGTLPPATITPTRERRQQEAAARSSSAGPARRRSSWTPRRYEWTTPGPAGYPSPRQEFGPPEYAPTTPPTTGWGTVPPQAAAPPTPYTSPGAAPTSPTSPTSPSPSPPSVGAEASGPKPPASTASEEPKKPRGYLRIVVGEPKQSAKASASGPKADEVREQADRLRRAGRVEEAKRLYQKAIELYTREAEADPTARAVKQAGIESCKRALEQCE